MLLFNRYLMQTLGFKTALLVSLLVTASIFAFSLISGMQSPVVALLSGVGFGLLAGALVFVYIRWSYGSRIGALRELMRAISEKKFDELPAVVAGKRDELSRLTDEVLRAATTMESEYKRLVMLENYRKDFIGDISHELKTPIFAIQGFVETLLDGALEDEEVNRHFLSKTMKNVNRLTILTNDLMEIAKLETGELTSHIQPLYISDMVQEVHEALQYRADEEGITLSTSIADDSYRVMGDRNQVRQVLINLVENGIKYNKPSGRVDILVAAVPANNKKVCISVRDTGIGIAPEHINRVTERFFRVDKSRSRGKGGTGLGLSIVKHILESHGSVLKIKSVSGEGTEFSFCLKKAEKVSA